MNAQWRLRAAMGATALVLVAGALWLVASGGGRKLREVTGESREAREAMEVLEALARDAERTADHMSGDAPAGAVEMVADVARRMGEAQSLELKSAAWWGGYLRVRVSWSRANAKPLERTFFFKKEGGRLRITGLQL